jgi:hypothetical protein
MTSGYADGVISFLGAGGVCPLRFRLRLLALRSREVAPERAAGGTLAVGGKDRRPHVHSTHTGTLAQTP